MSDPPSPRLRRAKHRRVRAGLALAARVAASEWSRGDASDIDGKTERSKWAGAHESIGKRASFNGAEGISDIEGKIARVATSEITRRAPSNSHGAWCRFHRSD